MRNFSSPYLIVMVLSFVSVRSALAADAFCGLKSDISTGGRLAIVCENCWNNPSLFAITAAAAARKEGVKSILIESHDRHGRMEHQFHVSLSNAYENASGTIGGGVGVTASITTGVVDPSSTTVTATRTEGRPSRYGFGPYGSKPVKNDALDVKCENIEEKAAKEHIKRDKAEALAGDVGNLSGADYEAIRGILNNITHNVKPWDDCSACVTESVTDHVQSQ